MREFKEGKYYRINGNGIIRITKRTKNFVTFEGDFSGRKKIHKVFENGLFGLGEFITISSGISNFSYFCFAEKENEEDNIYENGKGICGNFEKCF